MGRRKLLKPEERDELLGIPDDENNLILHYTLTPADLLEVELRRRTHNKLGFALQLCIMRYPGRVLGADERLPAALVAYVAQQLGVEVDSFERYAHREPTRIEHVSRLLAHLGQRSATAADRRAALLAAIDAAIETDEGLPITTAVVKVFRSRNALLPSDSRIEKLGLAGRAIARRLAEAALLSNLSKTQLEELDDLLKVDPIIGQTRLSWLRTAPDAPGADNLIGLMERLLFVRSLAIDPHLQSQIHSKRWNQMVKEGDVTPAWLAADFNAGRRRATIVVQLITLGQKLTDIAVTMFGKLIGRLFSQAKNKKKQRHSENRKETANALRMFRDTLRALVVANETGQDALELIDQEVGWYRLLRAKPVIEAMVSEADPDPLLLAVERHYNVRKYSVRFLQTFVFRSSRRHDPLISAIETLKTLNDDRRRSLPDRVPVAHLSEQSRKLIFGQDRPDHRLYEIATLAVLRERLRSGDIWVEGSRAFRPMDEHLMPRPAFVALKSAAKLGLGVQVDGVEYLSAVRQALDFNLKRLAHRARNGKLEGVRLEAGKLIVSPLASEVPAAAEELHWELSEIYPLIEVLDLLTDVHRWTNFGDQFTHDLEQFLSAPQ